MPKYLTMRYAKVGVYCMYFFVFIDVNFQQPQNYISCNYILYVYIQFLLNILSF